MITVKGVAFENLTSECLQSTQNDPKLKQWDMKSTLHVQLLLGSRAPNYRPIRFTAKCFQ